MAHIILEHVGLDFPVFEQHSRSIKRQLLSLASSAEIDENSQGVVTVKALRDITMSLKTNTRLGLLGGNGAGKTTLLRVLSGIYEPTQGAIDVAGNIVSIFDLSLGFDDDGTGYDNIFLRAMLMGFKRARINHYVDDIITFSELGKYVFMPLRTYSAGMKLRLAFSITTVMKPQILLMDEWLAVGDQSFMQKAQTRMRELLHQTEILVLASHDLDLVTATCDEALILDHGAILAQGPVAEVVEHYRGQLKFYQDEQR
ncbi:MAG: ATP-binding cassette domain-containing protein [Pseudomonadota bacterium]